MTLLDDIRVRGRGASAPLSFAQERLFLLDRIMPGLPLYNVPRVLGINASLDGPALERAFRRLVERHEILRTVIELVDGVPAQRVVDEFVFALQVEDLRDLPRPDRAERARGIVAEEAWRPFDLSGDLLLRATLIRVDDDESWLLVVPHHLASDHASTTVLLEELSQLYEAALAGAEPELSELPIQYSDFAHWQREQLDGDTLAEQIDYWRSHLADAPALIDLPTDRPRPRAQTYRGARVDFEWSPELTQKLRSTAREHGVSLFMALVAGFDVVLSRHARQSDVVIGTAVNGRHYEELLPQIGYFSNTLPLRVDVSDDPTFSELLARVRGVVLMAQANQDVPFEKIVEVVNPDRNPAHAPLFQTLVTLNTEPVVGMTFAGAPMRQLPVIEWRWSRFDLSFILLERADGGLGGFVEFASDLFDAATIQRMLGHLETAFAEAVRDPSCRVSELPLLTRAEEAQYRSWNSTERAIPEATVDELFAQQARRTPDHRAVTYDGQTLTYAELDERSTKLAMILRGLGIGRDTIIGICLERSLELPVALLGVLKAGAAYVPIDPSYPAERRSFMLADASAPVLLTEEALLPELADAAGHVLALDGKWPEIAAATDLPADERRSPNDLAYVIYTSGSTGRPKGVEIRHRSVVNLIRHMRERPGIDSSSTMANLTTAAFDLSVPDFYLPLLSGACLRIVPRAATLDAVRLARHVEEADVVQATPTTWQLLVDNDWPGSAQLSIVCGGEPVSRELANELAARGTSAWHMYGPTETTVWSSIAELEPGEGPLPIGGPISNTTFYVLDEKRQIVPIGVAGELYIGGAGVARGYRNQPALTAEKFVSDFLDPRPGSRLYRTGDLVRWRADGSLEFLGRIDQQVKLRGFRIELGEIESVLASRDDIAACVTVIREDVPGDRRLVSYVVPKSAPPSVDELRRTAREHLPPYMIPSAFRLLDSLPVTPNGKVDRLGLPAPDRRRQTSEREFLPPQTPIEEALASIWQRLLGVDRISVEDDFFELGGHSLLAVQMLALVEREYSADLPLTVVFEAPTVRHLAAAVAENLLAAAEDEDMQSLLTEIEAAAEVSG